MNNNLGTLHMAKEIVAKANALRGTVNKPRNISHYKGTLIINITNAYHTQYRGNGGKMILGNLWTGCRNSSHQTGFTHAWIAYQPHVSQQLQLQNQVTAFTRLTQLCKCRGTIGTIGKLGITTAATATLGNNSLLPNFSKICQNFSSISILDQSSLRNFNNTRGCVMTILIFNIAILTVLALEFSVITEIQQSIHIIINNKDNISTTATITAGWTALGNEFLTPKS